MSSLLFSLLNYLPLTFRYRLDRIRARFLFKWYKYFPTPRTKHLCRVCKQMLQTKEGGQHQMAFLPPKEESGQEQFEIYGQVVCPHHTSVQSLKRSADENCMLCSRLWSSSSDDPDHRESLLEALDLGDNPLTYCYITMAGNVDPDLAQRGGRNCFVLSAGFLEEVFPDAPNPATFVLLPSQELLVFTHWRLPSSSTSSAQSMYFAKLWYETCSKHHESCNSKRREQSDGRQWYPTRLIKISRWSNKLRLIVTEEEQPDAPYLTLSHCWGKTDFIQLTRASMSDFLQDIPYRKLPKTFQDAISMARSLGFYYIWIDSLCIIQREESLVDWKLEAPKMDKVYSHAVLNIAATGASDGSKGLFFPRRADTMKLAEIRLDWSFQKWFDKKRSIRFTILDFEYWKDLLVDEPLIRRAWVVQERLLAPRVLHFGSRQLFWECSEWDASEDFALGVPYALAKAEHQSMFKSFNEAVVNLFNYQHPSSAHAVWDRALGSYTRASLTKSDDKLIALAGIASELSPDLSFGYVAGLWKEYMATELLWYVEPDTASSRPENYRAPSFSWASVDGAIVPGGWQKDDVLIKVQDAFASTEMTSLFGSVDSGFVRLRGTVKRARLWKNPFRDQYTSVSTARTRLQSHRRPHGDDIGTVHVNSGMPFMNWFLTLQDVYAPSNIETPWMVLCKAVYWDEGSPPPEMIEDYMIMKGADIFMDDQAPLDPGMRWKNVYLMVCTAQSTSWRALRGLILEPTGRAEGEYRRLGIFMTRHGYTMNVLSVPHRSEAGIPCEEYDPATHEHTIVIV